MSATERNILIHNYLREQLERMRKRAESGYRTFFSVEEINNELGRRAKIDVLRQDRLRYPELQPSFH